MKILEISDTKALDEYSQAMQAFQSTGQCNSLILGTTFCKAAHDALNSTLMEQPLEELNPGIQPALPELMGGGCIPMLLWKETSVLPACFVPLDPDVPNIPNTQPMW